MLPGAPQSTPSRLATLEPDLTVIAGPLLVDRISEISFESWGTYWSADRDGGLPTNGFPFPLDRLQRHLTITETPA